MIISYSSACFCYPIPNQTNGMSLLPIGGQCWCCSDAASKRRTTLPLQDLIQVLSWFASHNLGIIGIEQKVLWVHALRRICPNDCSREARVSSLPIGRTCSQYLNGNAFYHTQRHRWGIRFLFDQRMYSHCATLCGITLWNLDSVFFRKIAFHHVDLSNQVITHI